MGTSLSGLTPATTFDGLLKTSDNEPLDGTLKAISTGDGTDTMLELSTTALQIGGATGMYWDNTNKRLGIGTDAPSVPFEVYGGVRFRDTLNLNGTLANSSTGEVNINNLGFFDYVSSKVGIGENTPTSRLHIKGSGTTSATTSLLVQNSAGATGFQVDDGGNIGLGNAPLTGIKVAQTSGAARFRDLYFGNIGSSAINNSSLTSINWNGSTGIGIANSEALAATAMLHIKGSGTTSATTSLLVQNSAGSNLLQANDDGVVLIGPENIYKNHLLELKGSGGNSEMLLRLQSNFNGGGGYTGIAFTNSTNGSGISSSIRGYRESDHYAIALNFGSNQGVDVLRAKNTGEVGIGETTPTARLHIKGSGNDATTTALLVQNSDGAELLKVLDTGDITIDDRLGIGIDYVRDLNRIQTAALGIGSNTFYAASGTQVHIKGKGTTSATTALLVENSAGTDLLRVNDDNKVLVENIIVNGFIGNINTGVVQIGAGGSVSANAYFNAISQSFGFGTNSIDASAKVDITSTTQGFLPPRMTTTERDLISTPAAGLMVYNTTTNKAQCYNGSTWNDLF